MDNLKRQALVEEFRQSNLKTSQLAADNPFRRPAYNDLLAPLANFARSNRPRSRWIIMSGLRGVGKTTLLAQLLHDPVLAGLPGKFYLSLDQPTVRGASAADIIDAIELEIGERLFQSDRKLFLFLDEIHFLPDWSVDLKVLHDRGRQLFMVCTGSSALSLNLNQDSSRRADVIRIPPLGLSEYLLLESQAQQELGSMTAPAELDRIQEHLGRHFKSNLPQKLQSALFESTAAAEVQEQLEGLWPEISGYWQGLAGAGSNPPPAARIEATITKYITRYMTLPYAAASQYANLDPGSQTGPGGANFLASIEASTPRPAQTEYIAGDYTVKKRIESILGEILVNDLEALNRFDPRTKASIADFLRLLANSDTTSLATMSRNLVDGGLRSMSINTIQEVIRALLAAEVIVEVAPLGSGFGRINRPYKYLFAAPALRAALSPAGDQRSNRLTGPGSVLRGRLLEDTVGFYLNRLAGQRSARPRLEYDARSGGADFVDTRIAERVRSVVIEAGWKKDSHRQIRQTSKRLKGSCYGLVVTGGASLPRLSKDGLAVYLPLKAFLLL